ncbi:ATP-binding protein [Hymenobacter yonginensis]|uniref:ATP-binding protein n=1 Tax=Hymenobacter yonginensis TaxID=748197 RepID=A0ABY7PK76_9BACT|nr:ATP-binding protein [Hymenobacter yonginensis]WBO83412.1 ATP-binding protein [Hymenobacter yonginensis]
MKNALRISCSRNNLKVVRDFVTDYLAAYHLADLQLNQIVLAVDEVVANLIIHANAEDESQHLDLALRVEGEMFGIEILDQATRSYRPSSYQEPDLQEFIRQGKKGGMGMTLVNRIMDRVEFTTSGNYNVCRLFKRIAI